MRRFPNSPAGKLFCHHEIDMQAVGNDKPGGNSPAGKLLCHHEIDMQAVGNDKPGVSYASMTKTFGIPASHHRHLLRLVIPDRLHFQYYKVRNTLRSGEFGNL